MNTFNHRQSGDIMLNHEWSKHILYVLALVTFVILVLFFVFSVDTNEVSTGPIVKAIVPEAQAETIDPDEVQATTMLAGSPMSELGPMIVQTAKAQGVSWKLVIGIAYAESSLGSAFYHSYDKEHCANYWGIKPPSGQRTDGSYLRCYYTDQDGVNSIVGLLSRRYKGQTPEQMCGTYNVPCTQAWKDHVNKYFKQ